ncbi:DUF4435 domain-containing protein [Planosporangium flavigriseum]|uniref:DUF4435 domain-containing protein n=1 Tax=Planosporangium flavigriseum TaxID=373681 RepID=A0A8J3PNH0_9ACTN|nr:DUF4435 domain-containing protein [Planosporangium flavigriseum]NJC66743.1 DUF4435 domain-containing protein [Planosporangium flavigriseum]GIG74898.1 hypothetical protein Pfl04_33020 [Planosporangium flavigriseum]
MSAPEMKSIREYDRPADRIRQHRQADFRPLLVVEGPSDARLMVAAFEGKYVPFPVGNRGIALETARQLHAWRTKQFMCVVDRDFDDEVARAEAEGIPIHAYENADLEAMLCATDALRRIIAEFGSQEKIASFGGMRAVLQSLYKIVVPVARLRAANQQKQWGLAFDKVDLAEKIDAKTLELRVRSYCAALSATVGNNPGQSALVSVAEGPDKSVRLPVCPRGASPYYRGRDLLAALGVALRRQIGSCAKAATETEHLAAILRVASCPLIIKSTWGEDLEESLGQT